jgi:F0F1-type ATP synthase membrane subunit c/vacuolar-type H+-ATPase subunit K
VRELARLATSQDPEATREVVGLLLNFLGLIVVAVILLLVVGLPLRSWRRQRRERERP